MQLLHSCCCLCCCCCLPLQVGVHGAMAAPRATCACLASIQRAENPGTPGPSASPAACISPPHLAPSAQHTASARLAMAPAMGTLTAVTSARSGASTLDLAWACDTLHRRLAMATATVVAGVGARNGRRRRCAGPAMLSTPMEGSPQWMLEPSTRGSACARRASGAPGVMRAHR